MLDQPEGQEAQRLRWGDANLGDQPSGVAIGRRGGNRQPPALPPPGKRAAPLEIAQHLAEFAFERTAHHVAIGLEHQRFAAPQRDQPQHGHQPPDVKLTPFGLVRQGHRIASGKPASGGDHGIDPRLLEDQPRARIEPPCNSNDVGNRPVGRRNPRPVASRQPRHLPGNTAFGRTGAEQVAAIGRGAIEQPAMVKRPIGEHSLFLRAKLIGAGKVRRQCGEPRRLHPRLGLIQRGGEREQREQAMRASRRPQQRQLPADQRRAIASGRNVVGAADLHREHRPSRKIGTIVGAQPEVPGALAQCAERKAARRAAIDFGADREIGRARLLEHDRHAGWAIAPPQHEIAIANGGNRAAQTRRVEQAGGAIEEAREVGRGKIIRRFAATAAAQVIAPAGRGPGVRCGPSRHSAADRQIPAGLGQIGHGDDRGIAEGAVGRIEQGMHPEQLAFGQVALLGERHRDPVGRQSRKGWVEEQCIVEQRHPIALQSAASVVHSLAARSKSGCSA